MIPQQQQITFIYVYANQLDAANCGSMLGGYINEEYQFEQLVNIRISSSVDILE